MNHAVSAPPAPPTYVGVDVAKLTLEVSPHAAWPSGEFINDPAGLCRLVEALKKCSPQARSLAELAHQLDVLAKNPLGRVGKGLIVGYARLRRLRRLHLMDKANDLGTLPGREGFDLFNDIKRAHWVNILFWPAKWKQLLRWPTFPIGRRFAKILYARTKIIAKPSKLLFRKSPTAVCSIADSIHNLAGTVLYEAGFSQNHAPQAH